jgi:hypothetical protein
MYYILKQTFGYKHDTAPLAVSSPVVKLTSYENFGPGERLLYGISRTLKLWYFCITCVADCFEQCIDGGGRNGLVATQKWRCLGEMGGAKTDGQAQIVRNFSIFLNRVMTGLGKRQGSQLDVSSDGKSKIYEVDISPKH